MPGQARQHWWCLVFLVLGLWGLLCVPCVAAASTAPHLPASAGLCEHTCAPASIQMPTPVALPTSGLLFVWRQPYRASVYEGRQPVFPGVARRAPLTRAPPRLAF